MDDRASVDAFCLGLVVASLLVIGGGLVGAAGIRNPRRVVKAEQCSGGQLAGAPLDAAGSTPRHRHEVSSTPSRVVSVRTAESDAATCA